MAERTDATLLELVGSPSVKGVVEIISGAGDIQCLVGVVEATTDALEEDDEDAVFHKREDESAGICEDNRRGADLVSCPGTALLALGPNDADNTEAVTKPACNLSPLETEALLCASYGSEKPLSDQSKAVLSENKGTPLNLVDSEPETELLEGSCRPTTKSLGKTEAKSSAVLLGLELDRKKGGVTSMEETAQEVANLAASIPMPEKEGAQVNGEEKDPAEGPGQWLVSESLDELEEAEEEEEEMTDVVQQESSSEGSHCSQEASPRCRAQSSGKMPSGSMHKSSMNHQSSSKYNTVSYRKIRKGNTKQRVDEFESMMHL